MLNQRKAEQEQHELAKVSAYVSFGLGMMCKRVQRSGIDVSSVVYIKMWLMSHRYCFPLGHFDTLAKCPASPHMKHPLFFAANALLSLSP